MGRFPAPDQIELGPLWPVLFSVRGVQKRAGAQNTFPNLLASGGRSNSRGSSTAGPGEIRRRVSGSHKETALGQKAAVCPSHCAVLSSNDSESNICTPPAAGILVCRKEGAQVPPRTLSNL